MMRKTRPVSVLLVATVSSALHGAIAVVVVPVLSFLYLISGSAAGRVGSSATELGMTIAVLAPLGWAAVGFAMGALMSSLFNLFVNQEARPRVVVEERVEVGAAAMVDAA